jgi:hypothetical protein
MIDPSAFSQMEKDATNVLIEILQFNCNII